MGQGFLAKSLKDLCLSRQAGRGWSVGGKGVQIGSRNTG